MANYKFSADIIDEALFRVGEPTDGTSNFNAAALRYLNKAYQALWIGGREIDPRFNEKWWWLRKTGILNLDKIITAGTVSVTNNSASITFSVAPSASVLDFFFKTDDFQEIYRISAHTGGSVSATLDSIYNGSTGATKVYEVFRIDYALNSDLLYIFSPMRRYTLSLSSGDYKINGGDLEDLERDYPLALIGEGVPERFALIADQKVRFNRKGKKDEKIRVEYDYIFQPADLTDNSIEEPVVPFVYRSILADYIAYLLAIDKNDNRFNEYLGSARAALAGMVNENRARLRNTITDQLILPRRTAPQISRLLRTESGLIIG